MRDQGSNIYKTNLGSFLACIIMTFTSYVLVT